MTEPEMQKRLGHLFWDFRESDVAHAIDCDCHICFLLRLVVIQGNFYCPVCDFELSKQTLSVGEGRVGLTKSNLQREQCPNDGITMLPVTWRRRTNQLSDRLSEEFARHAAPTPEKERGKP